MKFLSLLLLVTSVNANEIIKNYPFPVNGNIEVKTGSGDVDIVQGKDDELIVSYKFNRDPEDCKVEQKLVSANRFEITTEGKNCSVNFTITAPGKTNLNLKTGAGDLAARNIGGKIDFKTGTGDMILEGNMISFSGKTGTGDLKFKGDTQELNFKSGTGDLVFEGFSPEIMAKTGSGDMKITLNKLEKDELSFSGRTGSGNVKIFLPGQVKATAVDFKTGWGKLKNQFGTDDSSLVKIDVKTGFGDLMIEKL